MSEHLMTDLGRRHAAQTTRKKYIAQRNSIQKFILATNTGGDVPWTQYERMALACHVWNQGSRETVSLQRKFLVGHLNSSNVHNKNLCGTQATRT